jgi:hypothetical protein
MSRSEILTAWFVLALGALSGCGGGGGDTASYAGVSLKVNSSYQINPFNDQTATGRWTVVNFTLANNSDQPVAPVAPSFIVQTSSGLQHPGDMVASMTATDACPTVTLGTGGSVTCSIVADIPFGEDPASLLFLVTSHHGEKYLTVKLDPTPCRRCGDTCVDTLSDPENCGDCGARAPKGGSCLDGEKVCRDDAATICDGECVDLSSDADNCGKCGRALGEGMVCKDGEVQCAKSTPTRCGDMCANTDDDPNNCGSCGVTVPSGGECVGGSPTCTVANKPDLCDDGCTDLSKDANHCGSCSRSCGSGEVCVLGECGVWMDNFPRVSCDQACAGLSYKCDFAEAHYDNCQGGWITTPYEFPCSTVPPATYMSKCYYSKSCWCVQP